MIITQWRCVRPFASYVYEFIWLPSIQVQLICFLNTLFIIVNSFRRQLDMTYIWFSNKYDHDDKRCMRCRVFLSMCERLQSVYGKSALSYGLQIRAHTMFHLYSRECFLFLFFFFSCVACGCKMNQHSCTAWGKKKKKRKKVKSNNNGVNIVNTCGGCFAVCRGLFSSQCDFWLAGVWRSADTCCVSLKRRKARRLVVWHQQRLHPLTGTRRHKGLLCN